MWIVNAIVIHILLLGSIFVIYFRSPVINGLQPQAPPTVTGLVPPAKRLVLIVTDGLRAESFFKNNCVEIPHISQLMQRQGLVGVSSTHVPTESRPGHIAMIAGLYEDPSAVTRGWKENPIDFDTIFNRSANTYAWGANDVLHIFSRITSEQRMFIDAYDHDLDFSGREKTYDLDEWVFKKVKFFLERKIEDLRNKNQIIFFLHLLGLDSAGHIHKPNSDLFLENLHQTDQGIYKIYEKFESTFPDGKTAYVLTSDHGMTNSGSHGAGNPHETETPIFLWGSGIANKLLSTKDPHQLQFQAGNITLPLHEIEQAQIAPLISALLGLPPPMNNFGMLPKNFLNATIEYQAYATHSNALQLLEQFQILLKQFERGFFAQHMRSFEKLNRHKISAHKKLMETYFSSGQFEQAMIASYDVMQSALEGIEYYHSYYKNILLFSTTTAMLGWMFYLFQLLTSNVHSHKRFKISKSSPILLIIGFFLIAFVLLQKVTFAIAFYIMLPIFVWFFALQRANTIWKNPKLSLQQDYKYLFKYLFLFVCIEILVLCFFNRKLISFLFLLYNCYQNYPMFISKNIKFYLWCFLVLLLAIFPLLPPSVGYKNELLTLIGAMLILGRGFFIKSGRSLILNFIPFLGISNALLCMYQQSLQIGVLQISQIISWSFLVYCITCIFVSNTYLPKHRIELIFFNLSALYVLLCTSYEPIFVVLLSSELMLAQSAQQSQSLICALGSSNAKSEPGSGSLLMSFQLAFAILLYTFFSFFGTGNIASVSSFDPNIIRCFLTTFSPFAIMTLVILKLVIPVVINISIIFGLSALARTSERQVFICLLLICDIMGLNFIFLVRNQGSWLEIGSSISHFVIMEVTTVVLLMLTCVAKMFLRMPTTNIGFLKTR